MSSSPSEQRVLKGNDCALTIYPLIWIFWMDILYLGSNLGKDQGCVEISTGLSKFQIASTASIPGKGRSSNLPIKTTP